MALILADRVKESTTTTGTSDFALGGAITGFQTFAAAVGANNTTYYAIADGADFEVGLGTLSGDGLTLARTTVLQSSNADAKVSFNSGTKHLFVTYPADKAVLSDSTQTLTNKTLTSPKINEILDTNGNEILGLSATASATDFVTVKNGIGTGVPLHIYADGPSANIGLHLQPKGTGLITISDGTDFNKGIRFRSSSSSASAVTLIDAVSTAGRVVTLPDATTTLVGRDTTDTLTNKTFGDNPILFDGTANGVTYLNGSKVLTSGSALTFDGTNLSTTGRINTGAVFAGLFNTSTGAYLQWNYNGTANGYVGTANQVIGSGSTSDFAISSSASGNLIFGVNTTEVFRATSTSLYTASGISVGIGNSNPAYKLDVVTTGNGIVSNIASRNTTSGTGAGAQILVGNDNENDLLVIRALSSTYTSSGINIASGGLMRSGGAGGLTLAATEASGTIKFATGGTTQRMVLDSAGNLGLSFTPSATGSNAKALQLTNYGTLSGNGNLGFMSMAANAYESADNTWNRVNATTAGRYQISYTGEHSWYYTGSGGIGTSIAWTQAMTLNASGQLQIGGTSAYGKVTIGTGNGGGNVPSASTTDLTFAADSNRNILFLSDGNNTSTDGAIGAWNTVYNVQTSKIVFDKNNANTGQLLFYTNAGSGITERAKITEAGNLSITNGNLVIGTAGKGIDFSADPSAAGMTSELLDDYEEGTWTPTLTFGGASVGITYGVNSGTYTKIGNVVSGRFVMGLTSKGSSTGTALIQGLPFTLGIALGVAVTELASNFTLSPPTNGWPADTTTNINIWAMGATGVTYTTDTSFANNTRLDMWFQYFIV